MADNRESKGQLEMHHPRLRIWHVFLIHFRFPATGIRSYYCISSDPLVNRHFIRIFFLFSAHSLGCFHEHSRLDRDKYVTIEWRNIMEGEKS